MTAVWGSTSTISFSATAAAGVVAAGVKSCKLNGSINLMDSNAFGDSMKKRITGLKDWKLEVSGNYEVDTTSQGLLRSLGRAGSAIFWTYKYDGTNGYSCAASTGGLVENFSMDSPVDGLVAFSASIVANGEALLEVGTAD